MFGDGTCNWRRQRIEFVRFVVDAGVLAVLAVVLLVGAERLTVVVVVERRRRYIDVTSCKMVGADDINVNA